MTVPVQPSQKLVLVSLNSQYKEREVLNGTLQQVHTIVKNHPFEITLEWQRSSLDDSLPLPKVTQANVTVDLLRADSNVPIIDTKTGPVSWKLRFTSQKTCFILATRIATLSSSVDGSCFRLLITVKESAVGAEVARVLTEAVRVIAKKNAIDTQRKRARQATEPPITPPKALTDVPSLEQPEVFPTMERKEPKASTDALEEQLELKLDLLRRLTSAAHAASAPAVISASPRPPPARLAPLSAPMKASTSDLGLPSLFSSTNDLLSSSTFDVPLRVSTSGSILPTSAITATAPAAPLPIPATPAPLTLLLVPPDETLHSSLAVVLALTSRDTPEVRAQKVRRFVKNNFTSANPAFGAVVQDLASATEK